MIDLKNQEPGTGDYQFNVQPGYILANRRAYQA